MKTFIKYILGISLLIISFSCRKDDSDIIISSTTDNSNNNKTILSLIHSYGEKMNSNLKSTELLEIDSVIWYSEALLNYNFSRPEMLFKNFEVFNSNFVIPTEGNELISLNYAQNLYNYTETSIANDYDQIPYDEKYLRFTDLVLDSIFEDNAYLSIYRGYGYDYEIEIYLPFEEDDDWIWGTLGTPITPLAGKCDGTQIGVSDGSNELERRLNNPLVSSGRYIFTNLETIWTCGFFHYDPLGNRRLYVGWNYPQQNCLTNDLLTYYLQQSHMIIHNYDEGIRPVGKTFSHLNIVDDVVVGGDGAYMHLYHITYGVIVEIEDPE